MRRFLLILIIVLLCMCVSLNAKTKAAKQLQVNLEQWQNFRWQGIIQLQSSALSMRKNFVLAKTEDAIRFDVLDSGVLGLQAQPMVSLYLKDKAILNAPTVEQLAGMDLNWFLPEGAVESMVHFTDSLMARQQDILSKRRVETKLNNFIFDNKYRLSSVTSPQSRVKVDIAYNNSGMPTKITIDYSGSQVAELLINEREYTDISIVPLEASPDALNLEELLKGIDPDSLNLEELLEGTELEGLELVPE